MSKDLEIMKDYIKQLLINQNITNAPLLKDIFSSKDYIRLLMPVIKIVNSNPNASLTTLRLLLFKQSGLKEITHEFIYDTQITPGVVLDFGTELNRDTIICGNSQEVPYVKPMEQNTIFDLASTSKLFTSISIMKLYEAGLINLFDPITKYVPEFKNLQDVSIYDLLKFRVMIVTDYRVDKAKTKEEAEQILFTVHKRDDQNFTNAYTDMGAMVLRYIVEKSSHMTFTDFIYENITKPLHMEDTGLSVPEEKLDRVANENYSSIIRSDGSAYTRYDNIPGTPHDGKAIAIGELDGIAPGHAGLFSTKDDMIKLGTSLMNYGILNKESVLSISDNEVGKILVNGTCTMHYGSLVYLKQPDPKYLRVYPPLSGKSFMSPGFAGTTLVVDPLNKITAFIGSNRLHDRVYQIHPDQMENIILHPHDKKTFILPNGEEKIVCSTFTKEKEVMVKKALDLALQYQLLELMKPNEKKLHLVREL